MVARRLRREPHLHEGGRPRGRAGRRLAAASPCAGVHRRRGQEVRRRPGRAPRRPDHVLRLPLAVPAAPRARHRARVPLARQPVAAPRPPRLRAGRLPGHRSAAAQERRGAGRERARPGDRSARARLGLTGVAQAAQHAMAQVWSISVARRPSFFPRLARSLLVLGVLALAIGATTALTAVATLVPSSIVVTVGSTALLVVAQRRALLARVPRARRRTRSRHASCGPARSWAGWRGPGSRRSAAGWWRANSATPASSTAPSVSCSACCSSCTSRRRSSSTPRRSTWSGRATSLRGR